MLSKDTIAWIHSNTVGTNLFSEGKFEDAVNALQLFLDLDPSLPVFESVIEKFHDANSKDKIDQIKNFSDVEGFMKSLCRVIYPNLLSNTCPKKLHPDDKNTKWMLANMYKEVFQVIPWEYNLTHKTCREAPKPHQTEYLCIYDLRNSIAHKNPIVYSDNNIAVWTQSMLTIFLDLCYRHAENLKAAYEKRERKLAFEDKEFCKKIVKDYDDYNKMHGFKYYDFHWIAKEEEAVSMEKLAMNHEVKHKKILGEAGTGKSTALRRLEYWLAKKHSANNQLPVPVFIEMRTFSDGDDIVKSKVASLLGVSGRIVSGLMEEGEICLLLDGFNEMLNLEVKKKVAKELDNYYRNYSNLFIFLTDRAVARPAIPTLSGAEDYTLCPLTLQDKREFFEKNCTDEEALGLIVEKMEDTPAFFEMVRTPLQLKNLLMVVEKEHMVPSNITDGYIKALVEREREDKKDENVDYLLYFLAALTLMDMEEIPKMLVLGQMAKLCHAIMISVPSTEQYLRLAIDMGLLIMDDNGMVSFTSDEYKDYFSMYAVFEHISELPGL